MTELLEEVVTIAQRAGQVVMGIYDEDDFNVSKKGDDSPLTKADLASHDVIEAGLAKISKYPVISEEGKHKVTGDAVRFWLVDPLDGTKEFVKRRGEFTVNIALIESGTPVLGVISAPAIGVLYAGSRDDGAFKQENGKRRPIKAKFGKGTPKVVTSKSHRTPETDDFLAEIGQHEEVSIGSSLKLCLVAEGKAMLYPRLGPTYGWDTAAGDAVVRAAGGTTSDLDGKVLTYLPKAAKNPHFVAHTQDSIDWKL